MDDIIFEGKKKKKNRKHLKRVHIDKKYFYFGIMGLFLMIGVSYAIIFYMEKFESSNLGFTTDLLDVSITENGLVAMDAAFPQKDEEGIENDKTTFNIVNNNRVPIRVIIKLVEDHNSTLDINQVRFGILGSGNILNVDNLGKEEGVLYDFFMEPGQDATLESTIWLDYYYEGGNTSEVFSGKYVVEASNADQFADMYLSTLVGKDKGLYAINEDGTLNTGEGTIKEYRYSGLNPDNYVYFNDELWRIISVSNGMLKIVRDNELTKTEYVDHDAYYESIDETYKEYIANGTFNTGSINLTDTYADLLTNEQSATTSGYINYINASDYLYSADTSYYTSALNSTDVSDNTWLAGTYLTANGISGETNVLGINNNIPTSTTSTDETYNIKPCLYLKKTITIVGGYGTLDSPYELEYSDVKELVPRIVIADAIISKAVAYDVASPTTFTGGLVAVNNDGTLYNETDSSQKVREYRYSGPTVNNYIYFNCKDNDGTYNYGDKNYNYNETNCELWRIVGFFKNTADEWNLKLMRNTILSENELVDAFVVENNGALYTYTIYDEFDGKVLWNSNNKTDWTSAGLQYFLNREQDENGVKGYYSTITLSSKSLIDENYEYHLGNAVSGGTTITSYNNERGEILCESDITNNSNNNNCNIWNGNQSKWNGAIALLYPSDIGYTVHNSYWNSTQLTNYNDSAVKATSWMQTSTNHIKSEWLISPSSIYNYYVSSWDKNASIASDYTNVESYYEFVRPVINLKSDVLMLNGVEQDGSIDKPYIAVGN